MVFRSIGEQRGWSIDGAYLGAVCSDVVLFEITPCSPIVLSFFVNLSNCGSKVVKSSILFILLLLSFAFFCYLCKDIDIYICSLACVAYAYSNCKPMINL